MKPFAIGVLAERSGVKIPTIRYYETSGLLPASARTSTNRRAYDDDTVRRLIFIRHARELGFEMEAVRELLTLADHSGGLSSPADAVARRHLRDIDDRIERLSSLRRAVHALADGSPRDGTLPPPLIDALASHARVSPIDE